MITDKISNIGLYSQVPTVVVDFAKTLKQTMPLGRIILSDNIYANIEEYNTKLISQAKFESHDKYIDIQILLRGKEKIYIHKRDNLTNLSGYNSEKDITFYKDSIENSDSILLDGLNFVMLYPHEAHAPQIAVDNMPELVKKVVVKVKI